ncbi:MAG: hypothetical protein EBU90_28935 [Proteobacteria bacterium]|nr:hypothetical protein [Pseudomonadota bacterium]
MNIQSLLDKTSLDDVSISNDDILNFELCNEFLGFALFEACQGKQNPFPFITPEHFDDSFLAEFYSLLLESFDGNFRFSVLNLKNKFDAEKYDYVMNLMSHQPNGYLTAQSYAFDLDDQYRKRKIKDALSNTLNGMDKLCFNDVLKSIDNLKSKVDNLLLSPIINQNQLSHTEAMDLFLDDYLSDKNTNIPSLINSLDDLIGGFRPAEMIVIGGRPSMGKTAVLLAFIDGIASQGHNVLNFSLEMSNQQTISRFIALETKEINYTDLTRHQVDGESVRGLVERAKNHNNITHDFSQPDINQICAISERKAKELLRVGKRLDCIAIDYLQIIPRERVAFKSDNDAISEITQKLKNLAKRLNTTVILLSQLNRDLEKEASIESKRPNMAHLRQSGAIEQDADIIIFPFRPSQYERDVPEAEREYYPDYMELIIAKNRQGEIGIAKCACNMGKNTIKDYTRDSGLTPYGESMKNKKKQKNKKNDNPNI